MWRPPCGPGEAPDAAVCGGAMSLSVVGYAVLAAICLALASALQHQAASMEEGYHGGIHLVWRLVQRRRWLIGLAVALAGTLLHAAALRSGALAVVQPVLVTGVAVALPMRAMLERARPSAGQVAAAAMLAAGVALFVLSAHPSGGQSAPDSGAAAVVIAAGAAAAGLGSIVALRTRSAAVAGFALGLAAGILYGVIGGVLKAAVQAMSTALHDPLSLLAGWPLWTLVVLGAWAFIMHQRAYAHGPLGVSLPVLSVASPLAGMFFGILVFQEIPATGSLPLLGEVLGLGVIVVSVILLARPAGRPATA
jgi:drug/metabolite transporter (DMT)-like permease